MPPSDFFLVRLGSCDGVHASLVHFYFVVSVFYSTRPAQSDPARHRLFFLVIVSGAAPTFPLNPLQHRHRSGAPHPDLVVILPVAPKLSTNLSTNQPHIGHGPTLASAQSCSCHHRPRPRARLSGQKSSFLCATRTMTACLLSISGVGGQRGLRRVEALDLTERSVRLGHTCAVEHRVDEQCARPCTHAGPLSNSNFCGRGVASHI